MSARRDHSRAPKPWTTSDALAALPERAPRPGSRKWRSRPSPAALLESALRNIEQDTALAAAPGFPRVVLEGPHANQAHAYVEFLGRGPIQGWRPCAYLALGCPGRLGHRPVVAGYVSEVTKIRVWDPFGRPARREPADKSRRRWSVGKRIAESFIRSSKGASRFLRGMAWNPWTFSEFVRRMDGLPVRSSSVVPDGVSVLRYVEAWAAEVTLATPRGAIRELVAGYELMREVAKSCGWGGRW